MLGAVRMLSKVAACWGAYEDEVILPPLPSHHDDSRSVPVQTVVDPRASDLKRRDHKHAIQRELDAVRKLQGALNVAAFEDAYEDEHSVYIVTELCRGGELWHRIGDKHYSERTVSTSAEVIMHPLAPSCNTGCKRQ